MALNAKDIQALILRTQKDDPEGVTTGLLAEHPILSQEKYFCDSIEIESEATMLQAGKTFAKVVSLDKENSSRYRLGLIGSPGSGKSTFSKGLLDALSCPNDLAYSSELVRIFNTKAAGLMIHFDAGYYDLPEAQPMSEKPGIDIVEHAGYAFNPLFDCLIHFNYSADGGTRYISILHDQNNGMGKNTYFAKLFT